MQCCSARQHSDRVRPVPIFNVTSNERRQLQAQMLSLEKADGHVSLDHVHETAKRMAGNYVGMLIAMGASGVVLGFWNVYSTSLGDVEQQLRELDERQRKLYGKGITMVTVDNPHTVEGLLNRVLPDAKVKMDPGHVLFSRLGKLLDKHHALYGEATKGLARAFFDFNTKDLEPVCALIRSKKPEYKYTTSEGLVQVLPLSTWKRTVRRAYLQPELQLKRLEAWYANYILNKLAFVDTSVPGKPRKLVRGGDDGLKKFDNVLNNQLELVRKGMLSDPVGEPMYVEVGKTKQGFTTWRSTRGSSKNEAANLVIERSLHTTGRMAQHTAVGITSDRFARYNHDVKVNLMKAQQKLAGQASDLQHFDHCMDFLVQLRVNKLCSQLGLGMPYPFLNPAELQEPQQAANPSITAPGQDDDADAEQPQDDSREDLFQADWDEDLLVDGSDSDDDQWETAADQQWEQVAAKGASGVASAGGGDAMTEPAPLVAAGMQESRRDCDGAATATGDKQTWKEGPRKRSAAAAAAAFTAAAARPAAAAGRPVAAAAQSPASPYGRSRRSAAAGVALCIAKELSNNEAVSSDDESEGRQYKRRRQAAAASTDDSWQQQEVDVSMENADTTAADASCSPTVVGKQQRQPDWLASCIATRLAAGEVVSDVAGEDEEQLFLKLLPSFVSSKYSKGSSSSSNSSSPLRLLAANMNFVAFADKWNELAKQPDSKYKLKHHMQLKNHFSSVSKQHRQAIARQAAEALQVLPHTSAWMARGDNHKTAPQPPERAVHHFDIGNNVVEALLDTAIEAVLSEMMPTMSATIQRRACCLYAFIQQVKTD